MEKELLADLKRVNGKTNLLFRIADSSLQNPEGIIQDVLFPVAGEQTLRDLVQEWKASGLLYRQQAQAV